MPPVHCRNEFIALSVTSYHTSILPNNLNVFGRLPLPWFWLSVLQDSLSAQPDDFAFDSSPQPAAAIHPLLLFLILVYFIFRSDRNHTFLMGYKVLLVVEMHCKIPGGLSVGWHVFCSPLWTCIKLAKAQYNIFDWFSKDTIMSMPVSTASSARCHMYINHNGSNGLSLYL